MSHVAGDVFLWGPMGAGKSSVGSALAAATGAELIDTDRLVERRTAQSLAALFSRGGEPAFRLAERDTLDAILARSPGSPPRVVSLGGGALLDRNRRLAVLERGTLVTLTATPEVCFGRIDVSRETRPLLSGQSREEATETLRKLQVDRANAYGESHLTIETTRLSVPQIVAQLLPLLARRHVVVAAGPKTYAVHLATRIDGLEEILPLAGATSTNVVTDDNVAALTAFAALLDDKRAEAVGAPVVLAAGERHKTIAGVQPIWDSLLSRGADRSAALVAIGGGVVTDMTGFAAAAWHRGVRWIAAPTTLLGMVDASVGGKTGVDLGQAKNALGAFHPPIAVRACVGWLETEPPRSYRSGLAELLKTALIARPDLLADMLADPSSFARRDEARLLQAVTAATAAKAAIVSRDPEERGERAVLNLGHTLGHALEAAGGYERYTHGEAVGLGLLAALRVGTALGITEDGEALVHQVARFLSAVGLPSALTNAELTSALPLLGLDKKRRGRALRFITLERPGVPRMVDLPIDELGRLLELHGGGAPRS